MAGKLSVARMKALLSGNSMTSVSTSGDSTVGSGLVLSDAGVLTASVGGAAISAHVTAVSGAATHIVTLPTGATTGEVYVVSVETTNNIVLKASSETINGVAGATGITLSGSTGALCVKSGAATWAVVHAKV